MASGLCKTPTKSNVTWLQTLVKDFLYNGIQASLLRWDKSYYVNDNSQLPMCHVFVDVRKNFSASVYLLPYYYKSFIQNIILYVKSAMA
jgi:hypothetical protein